MKLEELAALVQRMRDLQKTYFKSRGTQALEESKAAERAVDRACKDILSGPGLSFGEDR